MSLSKKEAEHDAISNNMQNEVIKIASKTIGHPLGEGLVKKVRQSRWSFMGLEMMIDTVNSIEVWEIESYLAKLD